ncbi:MAG: choice-of-anchor D domain-containing protein [Bdellovibrionota bacterium]
MIKFYALLLVACIAKPLPIPGDVDTAGDTGSGIVTDSGDAVLELSDDDIDFGTVTVGDSDQMEVTIRNGGQTALEGIDVDFDSFDFDHFWVDDNCPTTLDPGEECEIEVGFEPQYADDFAGEIEISTDSGDASIDVNGTGEWDE